MPPFLVIGERRSPRAVQMRVRWQDKALAAVPLFEALRAASIEPDDCWFMNWYEDDRWLARRWHGTVLALGAKVQNALAAEYIDHVPLIHPAARGTIRLRANYINHVLERLTSHARL